MRISPALAGMAAFASARLLSATWRYRRLGPPPGTDREATAVREAETAAPIRRADPLPPAIYAFWHEHQLPLAVLHAHQDVVALTSRHRDGEIVANVLRHLGYGTARGSSSRGGAAGLREMVRKGRRGRPLAVAPDGPRGPARRCKPGVIRAASLTGLPVVPVGLAARRGWRLSSWDRFLVPLPGSTVFVSYGPSLRMPAGAAREPGEWARRLQAAIDRQVERCEAEADERPRGGVVNRLSRSVEDRIRFAWTGDPGPLLRAAGTLFGVGAELRHLAYDVGLVEALRPPIPVASVGGLTVGGSGKTPVTSELAARLVARGMRVAVLTRGFPDEMELHRELLPQAVVVGHPDRLHAARRAAEAGARVALLDDGFQHRRLSRQLEVILVDLDAILRTNLRRLPAGPFRERFGAVARADAVVVTRRTAAAGDARRLTSWLGRRLRVPVASLALEPAGLRPANPAAEARDDPDPAVALTAIMKPRLFFRQVAEAGWSDLKRQVVLPDHHAPPAALLRRCVLEAGGRGIVCTRKDVVRLRTRIPPEVPLWYLADRIGWEQGAETFLAFLFRWADEVAGGAAREPRSALEASDASTAGSRRKRTWP